MLSQQLFYKTQPKRGKDHLPIAKVTEYIDYARKHVHPRLRCDGEMSRVRACYTAFAH